MAATDSERALLVGGMVDQLRSAGSSGCLFEQIDSGQVGMTGADGSLVKEALERGLAMA